MTVYCIMIHGEPRYIFIDKAPALKLMHEWGSGMVNAKVFECELKPGIPVQIGT